MPRNKLIDWKFLAMLTVMLLATVACWGFVARQKQVESLIETSQRATQIAADARRDQAASNARDAEQIAALRRQVDALQRLGRLRDARQKVLLEILKANGIPVPSTTLTPAQPGASPKHQTPSGASPKPKPRTPSPRPTPAPPDDRGPVCDLVPLLCP